MLKRLACYAMFTFADARLLWTDMSPRHKC